MTATVEVPETTGPRPEQGWHADELWSRYGTSMWSLACALVGDETTAMRAVHLAVLDLVRIRTAGSEEQTRLRVARRVHARAEELRASGATPSSGLPAPMVWVSRMARLQRATVALCVYGRLTYREAAAILEQPPADVAELLTAGLRELDRLEDDTPDCA